MRIALFMRRPCRRPSPHRCVYRRNGIGQLSLDMISQPAAAWIQEYSLVTQCCTWPAIGDALLHSMLA